MQFLFPRLQINFRCGEICVGCAEEPLPPIPLDRIVQDRLDRLLLLLGQLAKLFMSPRADADAGSTVVDFIVQLVPRVGLLVYKLEYSIARNRFLRARPIFYFQFLDPLECLVIGDQDQVQG